MVMVANEPQKFSRYSCVCKKKIGDNSKAAMIGDDKIAVLYNLFLYILITGMAIGLF